MAGDLEFSGKSVLVTGAASGIGAACARWLAGHGAKRLALVDRDEEGLGRLGLEGDTFAGDVADPALWERIEAEAGPLDHAVINAGIAAGGALAETSFDEWRRVLSVNLDGAFLTLQAAMRAMQGNGGAIVLTASAAGIKAEPGIAAYGASKAAVIHLAKIAAKEGAAMNVRVNAIAPGGVKTPIWSNVPFFQDLVESTGSEEAAFKTMGAAAPSGRFAQADEIAAQIAFLLSDDAASITGACLVSDGGYTL